MARHDRNDPVAHPSHRAHTRLASRATCVLHASGQTKWGHVAAALSQASVLCMGAGSLGDGRPSERDIARLGWISRRVGRAAQCGPRSM